MNWELEIIEKIVATKVAEYDKKFAIEMYVDGWWTKEQVENLLKVWEE